MIEYVTLPIPPKAGNRLYGIGFTDNGVKVGRSGQVHKRIASHNAAAKRRAQRVTVAWISPDLGGSAQRLEAELISRVAAESTSPNVGREWFTDVPHERTAEIATDLLDVWAGEDVNELPEEVRFVRSLWDELAARDRTVQWLAREAGVDPWQTRNHLVNPRMMTAVNAVRFSRVLGVPTGLAFFDSELEGVPA